MKRWRLLLLVVVALVALSASCAAPPTVAPTPAPTTAPVVQPTAAPVAQPTTASAATSSAASPTKAAAPATTKKTMVVSSYSDPKKLNPYAIDSRDGKRIYYQVYERLINRDPKKPGEFVGVLASSWKVADDGMSIAFTLRPGVKFHNGDVMKASDVVFSFKTMATFATVTAAADFIDYANVKATDDNTIVVPLKKKTSLALTALANDNMVIVDEKWWTAVGDKVATTANGTNKFMIKDGDYQLNNQIVFTKFSDYWGTPAALDKITMRFIPENSQAAIELETGGVDLDLDVSAVDYKRMDTSDKMKLLQFPSNCVDLLHFNWNDKLFHDVKVRQAVAYAMNADDYLKSNYLGYGRIAYGSVTPEVAFYTKDFEGANWPYKQDLAKSKALLAEAGYANGVSFDLWVDQDGNRKAVSEILKNQLAKAGITANIKPTDSSALNAQLAVNTAQSWLYGVCSNTMDPDNAMYVRWAKVNAVNNGSNYNRWVNDQFSKDLDDARATFDTAQKAKLYSDAQKIWVGEVPSIPYYVRMQAVGAAKNLEGVVGYGEAYNLFDAYFK